MSRARCQFSLVVVDGWVSHYSGWHSHETSKQSYNRLIVQYSDRQTKHRHTRGRQAEHLARSWVDVRQLLLHITLGNSILDPCILVYRLNGLSSYVNNQYHRRQATLWYCGHSWLYCSVASCGWPMSISWYWLKPWQWQFHSCISVLSLSLCLSEWVVSNHTVILWYVGCYWSVFWGWDDECWPGRMLEWSSVSLSTWISSCYLCVPEHCMPSVVVTILRTWTMLRSMICHCVRGRRFHRCRSLCVVQLPWATAADCMCLVASQLQTSSILLTGMSRLLSLSVN